MGRTKIEWADFTFNPWMGCQKVSEGCKFCYAEVLTNRFQEKTLWGPGANRKRTSDQNWKKPLAWNKQAKKTGTRYRVFSASLADVFEQNTQVAIWRSELFSLPSQTPYLDWLYLTKRPENWYDMVPDLWRQDRFGMPGNVWLGVTVENQERCDHAEGIVKRDLRSHLLWPSRLFLSVEPLVGPIDLTGILKPDYIDSSGSLQKSKRVDWVIVGGESGPNARPMDPLWLKMIIIQCNEADVPVFFKQWGEWAPENFFRKTKAPEHYFGNSVPYRIMKKVGKNNSGRIFDGKVWDNVPQPHPKF